MLHEFIATNRKEIIRRCRTKVAARSVAAPTEATGTHGVPVFLEQLENALRGRLAPPVPTSLGAAFKFTRPGTTVVLRVSASIERVLIEIEDECGGLPGGNLNELFRPFEQRGADRTRLAWVSPSVDGASNRNEQIYARNLAEKGCVFTVDLPRIAAAAIASV
jgi:hypothetical protein